MLIYKPCVPVCSELSAALSPSLLRAAVAAAAAAMSHSVCETWRHPCLPLLLLLFRAPDWRTDHAAALSRRERKERGPSDRWGSVPLPLVWLASCYLLIALNIAAFFCCACWYSCNISLLKMCLLEQVCIHTEKIKPVNTLFTKLILKDTYFVTDCHEGNL